MKIVRIDKRTKPVSLYEFSHPYSMNLEITYYDDYVTAAFKEHLNSEQSLVIGRGKTEEDAVRDYSKKIQKTQIVLSFPYGNRTVSVPPLTTADDTIVTVLKDK